MERNKKGHFLTDLIFSKIFIILGTVFLFFIIVGLGKSWASNIQVDNQIKSLEGKISQMDGQNKELNEFLSYLQTDDFVAREGRTKLGLKKAGENLVIVKNEEVEKIEAIKQQQLAQTVSTQVNKPNWKKWWEYFVH